jgi:hypothetical protein
VRQMGKLFAVAASLIGASLVARLLLDQRQHARRSLVPAASNRRLARGAGLPESVPAVAASDTGPLSAVSGGMHGQEHEQAPEDTLATLSRESLFELAKHRNVPAGRRLVMSRGELIDAIRQADR